MFDQLVQNYPGAIPLKLNGKIRDRIALVSKDDLKAKQSAGPCSNLAQWNGKQTGTRKKLV